jgi:mono/diheme cytochrome c family protein
VTSTLRITLLVAAAAPVMACAPATVSYATPSYSAAQAEAGEEAYEAACLACHMPDLSGGAEGPALVGPSFADRWDGRPVAELTRFMSEHMPRPLPGVLNDRTYLALVAYLLAQNGVPVGEAPLTPEATWTIPIGSR